MDLVAQLQTSQPCLITQKWVTLIVINCWLCMYSIYLFILWGSRSKTHARLLVSEWHLQIWMCVFAAVAKDRERAAKGSRKVWIPLFIDIWVWVNTYRYIFSGMNIHLPAILGFTRYQGFDPSPYMLSYYIYRHIYIYYILCYRILMYSCLALCLAELPQDPWDILGLFFLNVYNTLQTYIDRCRHLRFFVDGYEQVSVSYCPMFLNWQWHPD